MVELSLFLAAIFVMLIGHELSHFLVARLFGFKTPTFGVGLPVGPSWCIFRKWDTDFRLHLLPLGGYVSIPELDPPEPSSEAGEIGKTRTFAIWKKLLVAMAGVGFYGCFAVLVQCVELSAIGVPQMRVTVFKLSEHNPRATNAGVRAGDEVISVNGKATLSPDEVVWELRSHAENPVTLNILRDRKSVDISVTPDSSGKVGMSVVTRGVRGYEKVSILEIPRIACNRVSTFFVSLSEVLNVTGVSGPSQSIHNSSVMLAIVADIVRRDPRGLYDFITALSVGLAFMHLIPWPGLDGSHAVAIIAGAVRGKAPAQSRVARWVIGVFIALICLNAPTQVCLLRGRKGPEKSK